MSESRVTNEPRPGQKERAGFHLFWLVISLLFTLPLLADWVAARLGWRLFFLADGYIQLIWATFVQVGAIWGVYGGLQGRMGSRHGQVELVASLVSLLCYVLGIYRTIRPLPGRSTLLAYLGATLPIVLIHAAGLWMNRSRQGGDN